MYICTKFVRSLPSLCYCRWFVEDLVVTVLLVNLCCFIYQGVTIFCLCLSVYFSVTNGFIPTTTITGRQLTPTKYLNTEESQKPRRKCTSVRSSYMRGKICYKTEFKDGSVSFSESFDPDDPSLIDRHPPVIVVVIWVDRSLLCVTM
jgi:hypothetical protein